MVNGVNDWLLPLLNQQGDIYGHSLTQIMVHVVFYVVLMTVGSMVFAKFWIDTTNMGTKGRCKTNRANRYADTRVQKKPEGSRKDS